MKRKGLDDSFESPMTLRSHSKKQVELVTDKTAGEMEIRSKGHNLRPRRERNKTHTK